MQCVSNRMPYERDNLCDCFTFAELFFFLFETLFSFTKHLDFRQLYLYELVMLGLYVLE